MLKLPINRVARDGKAKNYPAKPALAAKSKVIVDEPAQVQANKNYGGDINSNTGKNRRRLPKFIHVSDKHTRQTNKFGVERLLVVDRIEQINRNDFAFIETEDNV